MLQILFEQDDLDLMKRVWAFRHQRFVDQLGWKELRRDDNLERDEFDTSVTLHAVLQHKGEIVGYSRLLPTTAPHLVRRFSPLSINPRCGPGVYEWSRCAITVDAPPIAGLPASNILMTGMLECLTFIGAHAISFLAYPAVVKMMRRRGYPVRVLADTTIANGDHVQAVFSELPADLLARHRQVHGIQHSLVTWGATRSRVPKCRFAAA